MTLKKKKGKNVPPWGAWTSVLDLAENEVLVSESLGVIRLLFARELLIHETVQNL